MTERPILFSGPMVRAILAGTKTQTRRVIADDWWRCLEPEDEEDRVRALAMCPYGVPGDRLWVRETFQPFFKDGWIYLADAGTTRLNAVDEAHAKASWPRWKPSIHMPRRASRLTLEVTEVRVQRLQDISTEDAEAEGVQPSEDALDPQTAFRRLWQSINAKRAPWDSNPWVWAVTFRRVS